MSWFEPQKKISSEITAPESKNQMKNKATLNVVVFSCLVITELLAGVDKSANKQFMNHENQISDKASFNRTNRNNQLQVTGMCFTSILTNRTI